MKERKNNMKKAFVFDFDDTLATTTCKVEVLNKNNKVIRVLTAAKFNTYELKANETFSFEQFKQVINPVALPLVSLAKEVSQENHNVFILSARPSEAVNPITEFLRSLNIEVKSVICVGGKPINIAKEKRTVLMSIIENHEVVYFFDDDKTNVQEANKLAGLKAVRI
ncbi:uncharacterized protein METZ01_LOCUS279244 [marine metagenome]|uniref:FCP1 homology domain-containing protein n=1 Tax=marine metagenome TaxID=408172 RepID=A0A382KPL2_9ZZZZ